MFDVLVAILVLAAIGGVLGALIGVAAKFLQVEEDPRLEEVTKRLPGANCGGCGYPGCSGLAEAIVFDGISPTLCKPGKAEMVSQIKAYLEQYDKEHSEIKAEN